MWGVVFSLPHTTIFISGNDILSSQPSKRMITSWKRRKDEVGDGPH
jgi:hypothetical protein